jgi:hypothetical protein
MTNVWQESSRMSHKRVHARLRRAMAKCGVICGEVTPDVASLIRASVTGRGLSIPFCVVLSPGSGFCPGSARGRHLMGFDEDRSANLRLRGRDATGPGWRPDLIHRPGVGTSLRDGWCRGPPEISSSLLVQAAAAANSVLSIHMRCKITASLRASATLAFLIPARLASLAAQLLSAEPLTGRVKMMCAAW